MLLVGCMPSLESTTVPDTDTATTKLALFPIPYISDDSWNANPLGLLGQVVEIRANGGVCPARLDEGAANFALEPLAGVEVDPKSILKQPVKRESLVVDQTLAAKVGFLSYLSAELNAKTAMSLIVFDQTSARVLDTVPSWNAAIAAWKQAHAAEMKDPDICYLIVVKGYVQKNVVRRKYVTVDTKTKGGAYGVNVEGKYMRSSEDYTVDIRYGLSPGILKRPGEVAADAGSSADVEPSPQEAEFLRTLVRVAPPKR